MDKVLENYLGAIDRYLKPMSVSDRIDIVKEIKSQMQELQSQDGLEPDAILERLGDPKALAKAYLGEAISEAKGFSWKKLGAMVAFYGMVGVTGMIILPMTGISALAFFLSGVFSSICGTVKLIAALFGQDLPFIVFQIGSFVASPIQAFLLSIVMGIILCGTGLVLWKITLLYIKAVARGSRRLRA